MVKAMIQDNRAQKPVEGIAASIRRIADDAGELVRLLTRGRTLRSSGKAKLLELQARVDQLRAEIWQARQSTLAEVVEFPARAPESNLEPSLVDRVLAIMDRRKG
jgi:hypothetical protein